MTYHELLTNSKKLALELEKEESAIHFLLLFASKLDSENLLSSLDEKVDEEVLTMFNKLLNDYLYENTPVQYLINEQYFYGYNFYVNEDVLIPRPETEELVSEILFTYDEIFDNKEVSIVDIGTGSGAISVTLDLEIEKAKVTATDISGKAIEVARKNSNNLGANVSFLIGDMLEPLYGKKFDILVSNPPYIPDDEVVDLLVLNNEPHLALFGGSDGMKFYRIILENSHKILNYPNIIAFEHAYDKSKEMEDLVLQYFKNAEIRQLKDMQGRDRMTIIINKYEN